MFKRTVNSFISLLLALCVSGCSLFVPRSQSITVNGQPANATIVVNGQHQRTAPATIMVPRNKPVNIIVTKNGYNTFVCQSGYSIGPWGILDVIGGICFLVPFFGLMAPGAYELDQENFYYVLTPAGN